MAPRGSVAPRRAGTVCSWSVCLTVWDCLQLECGAQRGVARPGLVYRAGSCQQSAPHKWAIFINTCRTEWASVAAGRNGPARRAPIAERSCRRVSNAAALAHVVSIVCEQPARCGRGLGTQCRHDGTLPAALAPRRPLHLDTGALPRRNAAGFRAVCRRQRASTPVAPRRLKDSGRRRDRNGGRTGFAVQIFGCQAFL